jgi:hypothetical protein
VNHTKSIFTKLLKILEMTPRLKNPVHRIKFSPVLNYLSLFCSMSKKLFILLLIIPQFYLCNAQTDTSQNGKLNVLRSHLRISLLTCGVGEEAWETFGHTGVRVIDSAITGPYHDVVYNYGMFNGFDKDFELNFMKGKLLYYVGVESFYDFMSEYLAYKRIVFEQEMIITDGQKEQMHQALEENALPENKFYKYDFFFDNCATRIRDIIPKTLNNGFIYGNALPPGAHLTFRDIINQYFYHKHWTRIGVNILLGSKIDKVMTNSEIMFLPDFLSKGLLGATVNGNRISSEPVILLKGLPDPPTGTNEPLILTTIIALLTITGLSIKKLSILGMVMTKILLLTTGMLGCLILVMWFGTNHQACADNMNLLWLLPTNIILVFFKPKGRGKYALIGMLFIFVTLLLHLLKIQAITILEVSPLLLALLFVYAGIYKRSNLKPTIKDA